MMYQFMHQTGVKNRIILPIRTIKKYDYWIMKTDDFFPGCYYRIENGIHHFNGIIASSKITKSKKAKKVMLFLGVGKRNIFKSI